MHNPIEGHIADYIDRLPGKRGGPATPMHRENTRRYLHRLAAAIEATSSVVPPGGSQGYFGIFPGTDVQDEGMAGDVA
jgi:hypothetical protein